MVASDPLPPNHDGGVAKADMTRLVLETHLRHMIYSRLPALAFVLMLRALPWHLIPSAFLLQHAEHALQPIIPFVSTLH